MYARILRMDDGGLLYAMKFEADAKGDMTIQPSVYFDSMFMHGYEEITIDVWRKAWAELRAKVEAQEKA